MRISLRDPTGYNKKQIGKGRFICPLCGGRQIQSRFPPQTHTHTLTGRVYTHLLLWCVRTGQSVRNLDRGGTCVVKSYSKHIWIATFIEDQRVSRWNLCLIYSVLWRFKALLSAKTQIVWAQERLASVFFSRSQKCQVVSFQICFKTSAI